MLPASFGYVAARSVEEALQLLTKHGDDAKLLALEGRGDARAYVVYRDSLVVKQEDGVARALLSLEEARGFGANPGTIFLGLRDGAPE